MDFGLFTDIKKDNIDNRLKTFEEWDDSKYKLAVVSKYIAV